MASVRKLNPKDPKSPWVCEYTDPETKKRVRITPKTGLKKDADAARRKVEAEIERGVHVVRSASITFAEASAAWIRDCEQRHKATGSPARSTIKNYECFLKVHLVPRFGPVTMVDLKGQDFQTFLNDLAEDYSRPTLHHLRLTMALIIRFSIKSGYIKRNVLTEQDVRVPGERKRIDVPSREQIGRLLTAMQQRAPREQMLSFLQRRAFVGLALFAGMRAGEISALEWQRINFDRSMVEVRHSFSAINGMKGTKTRAGLRNVPLTPLIRQALLDLREHLGEPEAGFVFLTKNGENMRAHFDNTIWRPVMAKAGMTHPSRPGSYKAGRAFFHFHALRHVAVSLLIQDGVNSLQISHFVGHAHVTTTMDIYGHLFPEDEAVAQSMGTIAKAFDPTWEAPRPIQR